MGFEVAGIPYQKGGVQVAMEYLASVAKKPALKAAA
jgi:hypothetical protein